MQSMKGAIKQDRGYTYVELMMAVMLAGMLVVGLSGVVGRALETHDTVHSKTDLAREASEALQRMARTVLHSRRLILPLADNPNTDWPEHIREQTIPASPPLGSSSFATAVLAVTLPEDVDLDHDGIPDADNDRDGLIDEDIGRDNNRDGAPGIRGVDDNGDGTVDNTVAIVPEGDNDEDGIGSEDSLNGVDDDGDGSVDEDVASDYNKDLAPGLDGMDDDGDGSVDEGTNNDDDEDGKVDEDGHDTVVFYLNNGTLLERLPVPWDVSGDSLVNGVDVVTSILAEHVTRFRVERVPRKGGRYQLVDLTLELTSPATGEVIGLSTQVRVGGAL
jgi:type II secretory pathway pseudopilin PulG